jgi:hypothetical protein
MKRALVVVAVILGVSAFLGGPAQAQDNPSPARSGVSNNGAAPPPTTAESAIVISDQFGYTWILVRQGDGSYAGQMPIASPGQWIVTGRVNFSEFDLHAVNPGSEHGSGWCQSFMWSGPRSGANVSGTIFNEGSSFNLSEGCFFNGPDVGTIVFTVP